MSLSIRDLILANVPEDGSAIGNMALVALLRETVPELTDEEYTAAKDDLAAEGLLDKQIGERLGISESTVRNHWQHMFTRLDVSNRTEAVSRAIRLGLI